MLPPAGHPVAGTRCQSGQQLAVVGEHIESELQWSSRCHTFVLEHGLTKHCEEPWIKSKIDQLHSALRTVLNMAVFQCRQEPSAVPAVKPYLDAGGRTL